MTTFNFVGQFGRPDGELHEPRGVDIRDGVVAVVDREFCHVQLFERNGNPLRGWGNYGSDPGTFIYPNDVTLGADGEVYVVDWGNNRIQAFDQAGNLQWVSGQWGSDPGDFIQPSGIASDDQYLYVTDSGNNRIQILDLQGAALRPFDFAAPNQLNLANGLAVANGEVFIADTGDDRIKVADSGGKFVRAWDVINPGPNPDTEPVGVALVQANTILVSDTLHSKLHRSDRSGGGSGSYGQLGAGIGQFDGPTAIASDGVHIAIADTGNRRVVVTEMGSSWLTIGGTTFAEGRLREPRHLVVDPKSENVYVVDRGNRRVQAFDGNHGTAHFAITAPFMNDPFGIALYNGELYVTNNSGSPGIFVFDLDGNLQRSFAVTYLFGATPGFLQGIAVEPGTGNLWIADHERDLLVQLSPTGQSSEYWQLSGVTPIKAPPQLGYQNSPTDVAVTEGGRIFVADPNSQQQARLWHGELRHVAHAQRVQRSTLSQLSAIAVDEQRGLVYGVTRGRIVVIDLDASGASMVTEHLSYGGAPGEIRGGAGVALSQDGSRLFVSEYENHRVQVFNIAH